MLTTKLGAIIAAALSNPSAMSMAGITRKSGNNRVKVHTSKHDGKSFTGKRTYSLLRSLGDGMGTFVCRQTGEVVTKRISQCNLSQEGVNYFFRKSAY